MSTTSPRLPPLLESIRRIVFLGDDLTDQGVYPAFVADALDRLFSDAGFERVNAGMSGETPAGLRSRLKAAVIAQGPELVIVGFGAAGMKSAEAQDLDAVEDELRGCGARVLTIRPFLPADAETAARTVLDAMGCGGVEWTRTLRSEPFLLTAWEQSPSLAWGAGDPLPDPAAVQKWSRPVQPAAALTGPDAGFARLGGWVPVPSSAPSPDRAAFGRVGFEVPADGRMELQLGGSHPLAVWLNGRLVWRSERKIGCHANAVRLDVPVAEGWNEVIALSGGVVFAGVKPIERLFRVDGYTVARNSIPMGENHRNELALRDRVNAGVLAKMDNLPSGGHLTGSFIYAHALGYRGRSTLQYGVTEWRGLFRELRELGMDTAILGTSAVIDSRETFYPSKLFKDFRTWNVIEPMLTAAGEERMAVYLGGVGVSEALIGAETGDEAMARSCADRELACYRELAERYKGAFHGYYLASETGFWSWGNPGFLTRCFRAYFQRVTNGVKAITPELPILGSPYTVRCPGREQQAIDTLVAVHEGCPFTALAPQDSIGVSMNELAFLKRGLEIWKTVCSRIGAEFWVNCETFNIEDFGGPLMTIVPADFRRLSFQLDTAARLGARKLITWEAVHFLNPSGSETARRLRRDYLRHRNHGNTIGTAMNATRRH